MNFRNNAIDRLRANRRRVRLNEAGAENLLDLESSRAEGSEPPLERAGSAETVRRAMRSLPDEQGKCIEWAFLRGLTHLQLSELLGAPAGNVKTNIRRGLLRLRDLLQVGKS
jgi:RNA polymerase sigma-70 factor (ECF subfamily)